MCSRDTVSSAHIVSSSYAVTWHMAVTQQFHAHVCYVCMHMYVLGSVVPKVEYSDGPMISACRKRSPDGVRPSPWPVASTGPWGALGPPHVLPRLGVWTLLTMSRARRQGRRGGAALRARASRLSGSPALNKITQPHAERMSPRSAAPLLPFGVQRDVWPSLTWSACR